MSLHCVVGVIHKESGDTDVNIARPLEPAPAAVTPPSARRSRFLASKGWYGQWHC